MSNDTKIASRVNNLNDVKSLQRTLDKLVVWSNKWEMRFNVNKCGGMHIGKRNFEFHYQMNDGWVISIDEERERERERDVGDHAVRSWRNYGSFLRGCNYLNFSIY